jgi:hypothetical protein
LWTEKTNSEAHEKHEKKTLISRLLFVDFGVIGWQFS